MKYKVYHFDTFDNTAVLLQTKDTLEEAKEWRRDHYGDRLFEGADKADIVDEDGNLISSIPAG